MEFFHCMQGFLSSGTIGFHCTENKNNSEYMLVLSVLIGVVEFSFYGVTNSNTTYLLFVSAIFAGIGFSGFKAAIVAYRYDIMPEFNKTVYEGWFIALQGGSTFLAPFVGNFLLKHLPIINNRVFEHSNYQLLFIISFACMVLVTIVVFGIPKFGKSASR
jgi:MFS family permease